MVRGFGSAQVVGSRATELYSVRFSAPEILEERGHSAESDVYALAGVILCECVF